MSSPATPSLESLQLELQEAIATFRHQIVLLVQALSFIVAADAVLLGYGFAQKIAGILFVASLLPLGGLFIYIHIMTGLVRICYVAIRLEWKLSLHEDPLIGTWVKTRRDLPFSSVANLADLGDSKVRERILNMEWWRLLGSSKAWALVTAFALQLGLAIASQAASDFHFI